MRASAPWSVHYNLVQVPSRFRWITFLDSPYIRSTEATNQFFVSLQPNRGCVRKRAQRLAPEREREHIQKWKISSVGARNCRALSLFGYSVGRSVYVGNATCVCARTEQAKNISTIAICPITMPYILYRYNTKLILNCAPQNNSSRCCSRCVCVWLFFFSLLSSVYPPALLKWLNQQCVVWIKPSKCLR